MAHLRFSWSTTSASLEGYARTMIFTVTLATKNSHRGIATILSSKGASNYLLSSLIIAQEHERAYHNLDAHGQ